MTDNSHEMSRFDLFSLKNRKHFFLKMLAAEVVIGACKFQINVNTIIHFNKLKYIFGLCLDMTLINLFLPIYQIFM